MKQLTNFKTIWHQKIHAIIILFSFFLITFLINTSVLYAETEVTSNPPLNVTSDSMLTKKIASTIEFKGNVVVTREDSIIHADAITMFFTKETEKTEQNTKQEKQKIKKIVAIGNVKYFSGERKAFADKAVYIYNDEVLVLTGNMPKVITGENSVTGKKITLFQKDGKIIIEGGVNATFNPDKSDKQKKE
ncbi:MAG: hypothetical protein KAJ62_09710 [Desulfobacteraceae bacterium]|nr:hypothetical protein [Desulfobacteraceae bacterium]